MKVLIVVDVSNIFYCLKKFYNRRLDYKKFLDHILNGRELFRAIAYGSEMNEEANQFKVALRAFGFETKFKKPKTYSDPGKPDIRKADWDVGIAMDIVELLDFVDTVVIASADGDMTPCIEYIKRRGKKVEVIACKISGEIKNSIPGSWEEIPESLLEDHNEDISE